MKSLILVCDDAGFASVERGIRIFVENTGKPICADYLIEQNGAAKRLEEMDHPLISKGLHFELSGTSDAERVSVTNELKKAGTTLGLQRDIQTKASEDARRQLSLFRKTLRKDPAHIGTHGNFHTDLSGKILPWWNELMKELFGGNVPPMQLAIPHVRHNLYSWNLPETARSPRTPEEFAEELSKVPGNAAEFVMHLASPKAEDASLNMLFTAEMRIRDLEAAIGIVNSGVIERSGFIIVPVQRWA